MSELVTCWRCWLFKTRKRVDGRPVCQLCFLRDAGNNKGIAMDYSELTEPVPWRAPGMTEEPTPDDTVDQEDTGTAGVPPETVENYESRP